MIFFSTGETDLKQYEFNLRRLMFHLVAVAAVLCVLFFGTVTLFNKLYQNNTQHSLLRKNTFLKKKIVNLQQSLEQLNTKLSDLEEDTEDLEVLVGLTSQEKYQSEFEGLFSEDDLLMASLPVDYEYKTDKMARYLSDFEGRIEHARQIQDEIENKFLQSQQEIKHIPSIRPIQGAKITDRFGKRKDPFIERIRHHNGIDLAAKYGTRVYAAAGGVVEFTRRKYRLNKGYGRVVIINHGYGYKTLYGHLSKIMVRPGQKVKRWDVVGLSGDTGRATGPHLHYEVWHNGRPQNPEDFILN